MFGNRNNQSESESNVKITLIFYTDQLLFDIANNAWREGDITKVEDPHDRHQIQDIVEDGNKERVARVLNLAYSQALELLFPFTKTDVEDGDTIDNKLYLTDKYTIDLTVPSTFSKTSLLHIEHLLHEYFVYWVLQDWMSLIKPDAQAKWLEKASDLEEEIKKEANSNTGTTRIKLQPF